VSSVAGQLRKSEGGLANEIFGREFRYKREDGTNDMAKEKFDRSKPHVNVGTIGHIDHGKTP
jgi:GTPase